MTDIIVPRPTTGTGWIIQGKRFPAAPGLNVINFADDPLVAIPESRCWVRRRPSTKVCQFVAHTTKGIPEKRGVMPVLGGFGPDTNAGRRIAAIFKERGGGTHLTIDANGTIYQHADLSFAATFHASQRFINEYSIGCEMIQKSDASIQQGQLDTIVHAVDDLSRRPFFFLQRQIVKPYRDHASPRLAAFGAGSNTTRIYCGILGHRDCSNDRGWGDPGDPLFDAFQGAGYDAFDVDHANADGVTGADIAAWKDRQHTLGFTGDDVDGIPFAKTRAALQAAGHPFGLWVSRPGDDLAVA